MYQELIQFFGGVGTKYFGKNLASLKDLTEKSNLSIVYETYVGQLFFYCFLSLNFFLVYFLYLFLLFWGFTFTFAFLSAVIISITLTSLIATIFYLHPFARYQSQKEDLERNMVFGISYLSIISKSGVPLPKTIYYASQEKDFGEFAREFERIHKYIAFVGKDLVSSLQEVADRTPSERFKRFLEGIISSIKSGSSLNRYFQEEAKKETENYKERGEKYTSIMSMFADFYIVMLLIAPLCLVTILAIFSLMEASFLGSEIALITKAIVYIALPLAGVLYLSILNLFKL